jgi:hypothetical protein
MKEQACSVVVWVDVGMNMDLDFFPLVFRIYFGANGNGLNFPKYLKSVILLSKK